MLRRPDEDKYQLPGPPPSCNHWSFDTRRGDSPNKPLDNPVFLDVRKILVYLVSQLLNLFGNVLFQGDYLPSL
ncbi:UNVERIFIED_CONTAM: hypothetical protein Sradi_3725600 [Sesamum radiatum]|uniref:Uncharacterized protein n=1 Tax=Sesamum radiatum TaxID=300843 RepID=A0AAW2PYA5_SESRA